MENSLAAVCHLLHLIPHFHTALSLLGLRLVTVFVSCGQLRVPLDSWNKSHLLSVGKMADLMNLSSRSFCREQHRNGYNLLWSERDPQWPDIQCHVLALREAYKSSVTLVRLFIRTDYQDDRDHTYWKIIVTVCLGLWSEVNKNDCHNDSIALPLPMFLYWYLFDTVVLVLWMN